jgi:hypothetical protein
MLLRKGITLTRLFLSSIGRRRHEGVKFSEIRHVGLYEEEFDEHRPPRL